MQSIVRGPGTGGRMRTFDTGIPAPRAEAASRRGLELAQRSIRPVNMGPRQGRADPAIRHWHPGAPRGGSFEPQLVAAPAFDQPVHQVARAGVRDVLYL